MKSVVFLILCLLATSIAHAQLPCPPDLRTCRWDPDVNCALGRCAGGLRCECLPPQSCGKLGQACCLDAPKCDPGLSCDSTVVCLDQPKLDSEAAGGEGGVQFYEMCPVGGLVGLSIHTSGSFVDSVQGICIERDWRKVCKREFLGICFGRRVHEFRRTRRVGGDGGTETTLMCEPHTGVKSIFGRAGAFVDQLGIECGPISGYEGLVDETAMLTRFGPVGGTGGSDFVATCRGTNAATGLGGRSGSLIDKIGLYCYAGDER